MKVAIFLLANALLMAMPAVAGDQDPAKVSEVAGDFGGVAESCGIDTQAYSSRVEELLKHMAGTSAEADRLIAGYKSRMEESVRREDGERTIDCMDARRRFEGLPINQSGWTVETGWASELL